MAQGQRAANSRGSSPPSTGVWRWRTCHPLPPPRPWARCGGIKETKEGRNTHIQSWWGGRHRCSAVMHAPCKLAALRRQEPAGECTFAKPAPEVDVASVRLDACRQQQLAQGHPGPLAGCDGCSRTTSTGSTGGNWLLWATGHESQGHNSRGIERCDYQTQRINPPEWPHAKPCVRCTSCTSRRLRGRGSGWRR